MIDHTDSDDTNSGKKDFQLGLTMSGAISGGAYTAGVFDFLIQALDEWEKARKGQGVDKAEVPTHRVGIKVISGASAGAMTAAIGIMALADGKQQPQEFKNPQPGEQRIKCYLPGLYEAWVVKPSLYAKDVRSANEICASDAKKSIPPDFLCTSDVDNKAAGGKLEIDFSHTTGCTGAPTPASSAPLPVVSLLNAQLLDRITHEALAVSEPFFPPRPYISSKLHIYMTLSNLRGVPWTVKFEGGNYEMVSHGDRVHYAIEGLGSWDSLSAFGERDEKREIKVPDLDEAKPDHFKWKDFSIFALASGAFPVGLAARTLSATLGNKIGADGYKDEYKNRLFPIDSLAGRRGLLLDPSFPPPVSDEPSFTFRTADGGIIDNDPFEYARFCLKTEEELDSGIQDPSTRLPEYVDHAVIMISPFPASGAIAPEDQPAPDILSIFSALMPSLIDQVRFKPSELVLAADESYGSRYLIGPVRVLPETNGRETQARYPIASGLLGGFGGFVAQSFRDHDFQLGRRNCQWFLQTNFAVPAEKSSIAHGYEGLDLEKFKALDTNTHKPKDDELVILPLFGTALGEVPLPDWPQIGKVEFDELQSQIAIRFDAVAPALLAANVKDNLLWLLLRIALATKPWLPPPFGIIRGKALKYVGGTILADLVRRNQIEGWDFGASPGLDPDNIRLVLGELLNPAYDLRNVAGLAKATNLGTSKVIEIISFLEAAGAKGGEAPYKIRTSSKKDKDGGGLYTLASRKPGLSETLNDVFGGTKLEALLTQPRVDPPGL